MMVEIEGGGGVVYAIASEKFRLEVDYTCGGVLLCYSYSTRQGSETFWYCLNCAYLESGLGC